MERQRFRICIQLYKCALSKVIQIPNITPVIANLPNLFLIGSIIGAQNKLVFRINGKILAGRDMLDAETIFVVAALVSRGKLQDPVRAVFLRVFQSVDIRHDDLILARRRFGIGVPGNGRIQLIDVLGPIRLIALRNDDLGAVQGIAFGLALELTLIFVGDFTSFIVVHCDDAEFNLTITADEGQILCVRIQCQPSVCCDIHQAPVITIPVSHLPNLLLIVGIIGAQHHVFVRIDSKILAACDMLDAEAVRVDTALIGRGRFQNPVRAVFLRVGQAGNIHHGDRSGFIAFRK